MRQTPSEMRMTDMMTIDTTVFEIIGGGGLKPPPPRIVNFLKYPGSDRVKVILADNIQQLTELFDLHKIRQ